MKEVTKTLPAKNFQLLGSSLKNAPDQTDGVYKDYERCSLVCCVVLVEWGMKVLKKAAPFLHEAASVQFEYLMLKE